MPDRLTALMAATLAVAVLAGCSGDREPEARGTSSASAAPIEGPDHLSAAAWSELVDGLRAEAGTTEVYDLLVSEDSAEALVPDGDQSRTFSLSVGRWSSESSSTTAPTTVDLSTLDPEVVGALPGRTLADLEASESTSMSLLVKDFGEGPGMSIFVKIPDNPATLTRSFDLGGNRL